MIVHMYSYHKWIGPESIIFRLTVPLKLRRAEENVKLSLPHIYILYLELFQT